MRETSQQRRLHALTRAAYTAAAGHLEVDPEPDEPRVRRWWASTRAAVVAGATVLLLAAVLALRAWASAPDGAVPLPPVPATSPTPQAPAPDGGTVGPTVGSGVGTSEEPPTPEAEPVGHGSTEVVVHVAGQVHRPGVVTLPVGARVSDAVAAAGGAAPDAELAAVNLARVLSDGEQVYVPGADEEVPLPAAGGGGAAPGDPAAGAPAPAPVDLNSAGTAELETLPGIGPALAQRIIAWREANGAFTDVSELEEVSGIGPATMAELRDRVTV